VPSPDPSQPNPHFESLVDDFIADRCRLDPGMASFLGKREWDHNIADTSAAGHRHREARNRHWLGAFAQVDPSALTQSQSIDRELVLARVGGDVATADFELFLHQARPEAEATAAALDRLAAVAQTVENARNNLDAALASPDVLRRDLQTIRGQAQFLRQDLAGFVSDPALQEQLRAAAAPAAAAYDDLGDHVEALAKVAHGTFVFGQERYNMVLQISEQLDYDARTLREMGWREYQALAQEMGEVAQRVAGTTDWQRLLTDMQKQHAPDMQGMLREYADATSRARQFVIDHDLMTVPAGEHCDVLPAPAFMRGSTVVASYFPAAPFLPGTKGTFNVPFTPDGASGTDIEERLETNAHYEIPSTTAHEAYPGHHLHFVHVAGAGRLRQFLDSTYFVEGWALYTEKMMGEQGFYRTDEELLGQLGARIFRAARIIVDTGLHLGEMSLDEAAEFMHEKAGLPASVARGEAERYAAWPTQASAYITGALAIEAMRDRWLAEKRGTLREFHDGLAGTGALPPGLAGRAIGLDPVPSHRRGGDGG